MAGRDVAVPSWNIESLGPEADFVFAPTAARLPDGGFRDAVVVFLVVPVVVVVIVVVAMALLRRGMAEAAWPTDRCSR